MMKLVAAIVVFLFAALGLGLGVLFGRAPVRGSCGGLSSGSCGACDNARRCGRRQRSETIS
jgi:hypothetical protein